MGSSLDSIVSFIPEISSSLSGSWDDFSMCVCWGAVFIKVRFNLRSSISHIQFMSLGSLA